MICTTDSMNSLEKIDCSLRPLNEYSFMESEKKRFGRYHGSIFWDVPKFGKKKWVVGVKIDLDFNDLSGVELTIEEIARACLAHLNTPPPRKKYAKKPPQPKYGNIEYYKANLIENEKDRFISALVVTDKKKSKMFWRKGKNV